MTARWRYQMLTFLMVLFLAACGDKGEDSAAEVEATEPA